MNKRKLQNQINEDALLREVVEDVKNEQLQQLWNKYGLYIIVGIALVLTIAISFEGIKSWRDKKHQELSNAYAVAMSLQSQGRLDESLDIYNTLSEKASGIYDDLAKMQIANIFLEQGKKNEALDVLENLIDNDNILPQMRNIAAMKLASYKMDMGVDADEITALLLPVIEDDSRSDIARELLAMLYIREKDVEKAEAEYKQIITSATASDAIKTRASDMLNLLNEQ
ncbi:MAG: tetratricopeptide repeat protein [Alphaproteobacteria bacterium]|nr:tetratricopeptide repeat protein [Alphaproteobacteria bacterium]